MKNFFEVWHGRCRTHTLAIILFCMMVGTVASGQQGGTITYGAISDPDPITGLSHCVVLWSGNATTSAKRVLIQGITITSASGGTPCIDLVATQNSFNSSFLGAGGTAPAIITLTAPNTIRIDKNSASGNVVFTLAASYTPLCTLFFRVAPAPVTDPVVTISLNAIKYVKKSSDNTQQGITGSNYSDTIVSPGISIGGAITTDGNGSLCGGFIENFTVQLQSAAGCWSGSTSIPYSELFAGNTYQFTTLPSGMPYRITPSKTGGCDCGTTGSPSPWINTADHAIVTDIILGITPYPTLAEILAGDANNTNSLTALDGLQISYCQLGLLPSLPWKFYPVLDFISNDPPGCSTSCYPSPPIPQFYDLSSVTVSDNNLDFIAVKVGDVNQDCADCGTHYTAPSDTRSITQPIEVFYDEQKMIAGEVIVLPFKISMLEGLRVFDLGLYFNAEYLEVLSVEKGDLPDEFAVSTITDKENATAVHYVWFTDQLGLKLTEGGALVNVRLRAKRNITTLKGMIWQKGEEKMNNAYWAPGKERSNHSRLILKSPIYNHSEFQARLSGSNLIASSIASIEIFVPSFSEASLSLYDANGKSIKIFHQLLNAGWNTLAFENLSLSPSVYAILVQTDFGQETLRFIKL